MRLSIVVIALNSPVSRAQCLDALFKQLDPDTDELLVIGHALPELTSPQNLRQIEPLPEDNVPEMRRRAVMESRGEIVALLEDDCICQEGWRQALIESHQEYDIVGGPLIPGQYQSGLDWAVFLCEYAPFIPPFEGSVAKLPGNNVSYKRDPLIKRLIDRSGLDEIAMHDAWRAQGAPLFASASMAAKIENRWHVAHVTTVPYHHGRAFGGTRFSPWPPRLLFAGLGPLIPGLKTLRILQRVTKSQMSYTIRFAQAAVWIMIYLIAWSIGESIGYLFGPGRSPDHWR